jgi:hypothetical protein
MRQSGSEPIFDSDSVAVVGNNCYDYAFGDNRPSPGSKNDMVRNGRGGWIKKKPRFKKSEPGAAIGDPNTTFTTCGKGRNSMRSRILYDNPTTVYALPKGHEAKPCKNGYYKVMSFVGTSKGEIFGDFHFYKQVGGIRYRIQLGDTVKKVAKFFRVKESVIREAMKHSSAPRNYTNGLVDERKNIVPGRIIKFPVNLWAHKLGWGTRPLLVDASGKTIYDPRKANRKYGVDYKFLCGGYCVRPGKAVTGDS